MALWTPGMLTQSTSGSITESILIQAANDEEWVVGQHISTTSTCMLIYSHIFPGYKLQMKFRSPAFTQIPTIHQLTAQTAIGSENLQPK